MKNADANANFAESDLCVTNGYECSVCGLNFNSCLVTVGKSTFCHLVAEQQCHKTLQ